jgi:hypothetical protein
MNHFRSTRTKLAIALGITALAAGCASAPPRPSGALQPMEGGRFQSVVKAEDKAGALKTFSRDAELTCTKGGEKSRMPWEAKPAPGKYAVVSQNVVEKAAEKVKSTDNKMLDVGVALGVKRLNMEGKDSVEITTVFKCE